jgi:ABC-type antimicrobial peptide transport system ATPase subunit
MSQSASLSVDARVGSEGSRVDLDDVCRHFSMGETVVKALDGVNLHVDEAAFVVVLGANGVRSRRLLASSVATACWAGWRARRFPPSCPRSG